MKEDYSININNKQITNPISLLNEAFWVEVKRGK
tara:strand:+ start:538 stop:639 length:102 start_codon:yes stop_codon:yes gene_type:complete